MVKLRYSVFSSKSPPTHEATAGQAHLRPALAGLRQGKEVKNGHYRQGSGKLKTYAEHFWKSGSGRKKRRPTFLLNAGYDQESHEDFCRKKKQEGRRTFG